MSSFENKLLTDMLPLELSEILNNTYQTHSNQFEDEIGSELKKLGIDIPAVPLLDKETSFGADLRSIPDPIGLEAALSDNESIIKKNSLQKEIPIIKTFLTRNDSIGSLLSDISGTTNQANDIGYSPNINRTHSPNESLYSTSSKNSVIYFRTTNTQGLLQGFVPGSSASEERVLLKMDLRVSKKQVCPFLSPLFMLAPYKHFEYAELLPDLDGILTIESVIYVGKLFTLLNAKLYAKESKLILKVFNPQINMNVNGKSLLMRDISLHKNCFKKLKQLLISGSSELICTIPLYEEKIYEHLHESCKDDERRALKFQGIAYDASNIKNILLLEHERRHLKEYSLQDLLMLCINILDACNTLYMETKIIMLSLSTFNIFLDPTTKKVYFLDFTFSVTLPPGDNFVFMDTESQLKDGYRSSIDNLFTAPEVNQSDPISVRADIYSVGVIFFLLFRDMYSTTVKVDDALQKRYNYNSLCDIDSTVLPDLDFFKVNGYFQGVNQDIQPPLLIRKVILSMLSTLPQDRPATYSLIRKEFEFVLRIEEKLIFAIEGFTKSQKSEQIGIQKVIEEKDYLPDEDEKRHDSKRLLNLKSNTNLLHYLMSIVDDVLLSYPLLLQKQEDFRKQEFWKERDIFIAQLEERDEFIQSLQLENQATIDKLKQKLMQTLNRCVSIYQPLNASSLNSEDLGTLFANLENEEEKLYKLVQHEIWRHGTQFLDNLQESPTVLSIMEFIKSKPTLDQYFMKLIWAFNKIDQLENDLKLYEEIKASLRTSDDTITRLKEEVYQKERYIDDLSLHISKKNEKIQSMKLINEFISETQMGMDELKEELRNEHLLRVKLEEQISQTNYSLSSTEDMCKHFRLEIHKLMEEKIKIQEEFRHLHDAYYLQQENFKSCKNAEKLLEATKLKYTNEVKKSKALESRVTDQESKYESLKNSHEKEIQALQSQIKALEKDIRKSRKEVKRLHLDALSRSRVQEKDSSYNSQSSTSNPLGISSQHSKMAGKNTTPSFKRRYTSQVSDLSVSHGEVNVDVSVQSDFVPEEIATLKKRIQLMDEVLVSGKKHMLDFVQQQKRSQEELKEANNDNINLKKKCEELQSQLQKAKRIIQYFDFKLKSIDSDRLSQETERNVSTPVVALDSSPALPEEPSIEETDNIDQLTIHQPEVNLDDNISNNGDGSEEHQTYRESSNDPVESASRKVHITPISIPERMNPKVVVETESPATQTLGLSSSPQKSLADFALESFKRQNSPETPVSKRRDSPLPEQNQLPHKISDDKLGNSGTPNTMYSSKHGEVHMKKKDPDDRVNLKLEDHHVHDDNASSIDNIKSTSNRERSSSFKAPSISKLFKRFRRPRSNSSQVTPQTPVSHSPQTPVSRSPQSPTTEFVSTMPTDQTNYYQNPSSPLSHSMPNNETNKVKQSEMNMGGYPYNPYPNINAHSSSSPVMTGPTPPQVSWNTYVPIIPNTLNSY